MPSSPNWPSRPAPQLERLEDRTVPDATGTGVNHPPEIATRALLTNLKFRFPASIPENSRERWSILSFAAQDPDPGQTLTYSVSDPRFELVDETVWLKAGHPLDYETEQEVRVTVTATDNGQPPLSVSVTHVVGVGNRPDTPSAVAAYRFAGDGAWTFDANANGVYDSGADTVYPSYGGAGGSRVTGQQETFRLTVPLTTDVFNSGAARAEPVSVPIVGDWNNDGFDEVGYFRDGLWHFDKNGNGVEDAGDETASFGGVGDQPVVGRFFRTEFPDQFGQPVRIGVFTTRFDGVPRFVVDQNGNRQLDPEEERALPAFGAATDDAVVGDWTGDGITRVGVFRPNPNDNLSATFSLDLDGDFAFDGPGETFVYGLATDAFVVGDWGGVGRDSVAALRPAGDGSGTTLVSLDMDGDLFFDPSRDRVTRFGTDTDYFVAGRWKAASALRILGGTADPLASRLSQADLAALVPQAKALWAAAGFDVSPLSSLRLEVRDLGDDRLGVASGATVTLDDDAVGRGWSLAGSPGQVDALSAVMHELGHVLGLEDRFDADPFTDVMAGYLPPGVRRTGGPH